VFTFGVHSGNIRELNEMASKPSQEHSFLLPSFEQFAALARRALHQGDNKKKYICITHQLFHIIFQTYVLVHGLSCKMNQLVLQCCVQEANVDALRVQAVYVTRSRGVLSAYVLLDITAQDCVEIVMVRSSSTLAFIQNIIISNCLISECPAGTFASTQVITSSNSSIGNLHYSSRCLACPDPGHDSPPGSTSINQCRCKEGFVESDSNPKKCQGPYIFYIITVFNVKITHLQIAIHKNETCKMRHVAKNESQKFQFFHLR
jgi:hypothetical protein